MVNSLNVELCNLKWPSSAALLLKNNIFHYKFHFYYLVSTFFIYLKKNKSKALQITIKMVTIQKCCFIVYSSKKYLITNKFTR